MDSCSMPKVAARRAGIPKHASATGDTDLVIVVLNELACMGNAGAYQCLCSVDYAGMYPVTAEA